MATRSKQCQEKSHKQNQHDIICLHIQIFYYKIPHFNLKNQIDFGTIGTPEPGAISNSAREKGLNLKVPILGIFLSKIKYGL